MADPSLIFSSTFTSNPLERKEGEVMVVEESNLRPRRALKEYPQIEEVDTKYKELILTIPADEPWGTMKTRQFQGICLFEVILPGVLAMQEVFKPKPSDVIVASFPKSGTTWLKALVFTVTHRNKYSLFCHPLLKLNPHDCVPSIEFQYASGDECYLETLPSPRVLGTHLPYSLLPESIKASTCPIVYICREPKDVIVSWWHMMIRSGQSNELLPFTLAFELLCEGRLPYGPIWDHVLGYYTKSVHSPEKILFFKYEEMIKNPTDAVMRLADFIGCPFSEEEVNKGLVEAIIELCSFDKLKDLEVNKNDGTGYVENDLFFRKAVVGGWQSNLTAEMATKLDQITKEKLHDSGFTFGVPHG